VAYLFKQDRELFGYFLRWGRKRKFLTQKDVAKKLGINNDKVSKREKARVPTQFQDGIRHLEALGLTKNDWDKFLNAVLKNEYLKNFDKEI